MSLSCAQTKRMNLYEAHAWSEIETWEYNNKGTLWDSATDSILKTSAEIASMAGNVGHLPLQLNLNIKNALETGLKSCFNGGMTSVNLVQILAQASKHLGREITDITELSSQPLEHLDALANQYATHNQLLAVLEGVGMGLGGLLFIAADIPALIMINLRLLIQLACIYGIDVSKPEEQEFLMSIMLLASEDPKDRHNYFWLLDKAMGIDSQSLPVSTTTPTPTTSTSATPTTTPPTPTSPTTTPTFTPTMSTSSATPPLSRSLDCVGSLDCLHNHAYRIAVKLSSVKLLQIIPVVGMAIGAGSNYAFTREITTTGMCVLRKRWIMRKYSLLGSVLRHRSAIAQELLQNDDWVIVNQDHASVNGDDEEDDGDFK